MEHFRSQAEQIPTPPPDMSNQNAPMHTHLVPSNKELGGQVWQSPAPAPVQPEHPLTQLSQFVRAESKNYPVVGSPGASGHPQVSVTGFTTPPPRQVELSEATT